MYNPFYFWIGTTEVTLDEFITFFCRDVIKSCPEKTLKRKYKSPCRSKIENEGPELILKSISEKPASLLPSSEG